MAILDRIYQKIGDHLLNLFLICMNVNRTWVTRIKDQGDPFFRSFHFEQVKNVLYEFYYIKIFPFQVQVSDFKLGDQVQILDNVNEAFYPFGRPLQVFFAHFFILHGPVKQGVYITLYGKQGGL